MEASETMDLRVCKLLALKNVIRSQFQIKKDGIEISDFPETGRGIKAAKDLPDGQLILTVKDVITVERIIEAEFDGHLSPCSQPY